MCYKKQIYLIPIKLKHFFQTSPEKLITLFFNLETSSDPSVLCSSDRQFEAKFLNGFVSDQ